jgi:3-isopropylmalate/(R)-2-methylmalate dehydratase large subunit
MDMEGRFTLCNLTVELGAKFGVIAPDARTVDWIQGRTFAPRGTDWQEAVAAWEMLRTDPGAKFNNDLAFNVTSWAPTVTWGTSPEHAIAIDERVPDPASAHTEQQREAWRSALDYVGLEAGQPIAGTPVDWVFIGSCANSRISDLRAAAAVVKGRQVAGGITAWVVPGSEAVRARAEAEGLDQVFLEAGLAWRAPGCSLCVAANGDRIPRGARCVSTSNRNFVGRQGPGARTHLASPAMAAAAAVTGHLVDVRSL